MTTKQIDYCIEPARTLNFSHAAENAFVSQPTFSYQVKLPEDEVGFKIFERNGVESFLKDESDHPGGSNIITVPITTLLLYLDNADSVNTSHASRLDPAE